MNKLPSANHDAIVKFAARGAGTIGIPPVSAPLADPNAVSSDAVTAGVDAVLRIVCMSLLQGVIQHSGSMSQLANLLDDQGNKEYTQGVANSLVYMRDRIGVPRDMKLPAAQQLRAHLNWALDALIK
jgi:glutathione S-transferase